MTGGKTVASLQDIDDVLRTPMPPPNGNQGPCDDTSHVMQEAIGFYVEGDEVSIVTGTLPDVATKHSPNGVLVLVRSRRKGAEVP